MNGSQSCFRPFSGPLQGFGDRCPLRAICPPVLHLSMALHSISSLSEPSHTLSPTHPHLYIPSYYSTPGLWHRHASFLRRGTRDMPVQASTWASSDFAIPGVRRANQVFTSYVAPIWTYNVYSSCMGQSISVWNKMFFFLIFLLQLFRCELQWFDELSKFEDPLPGTMRK